MVKIWEFEPQIICLKPLSLSLSDYQVRKIKRQVNEKSSAKHAAIPIKIG